MALKQKKICAILPKPKITFSQLGQIFFTIKEVVKIVAPIHKSYLIALFVLSAVWGLSAVPGFFIEKYVIDSLVQSIGNPNWQPIIWGVGALLFLSFLLEVGRNFISRAQNFLQRTLSRYFTTELENLMAKKLAELDLATIEDSEFKDRFAKIRDESGHRAWDIMMPVSDIPNYLVGFFLGRYFVFTPPCCGFGGCCLFSASNFCRFSIH